jgi:pilus assembly protein CpaF
MDDRLLQRGRFRRWVTPPGRVVVAKRGRSELTTTILDESHVCDLVEKMVKITGVAWI